MNAIQELMVNDSAKAMHREVIQLPTDAQEQMAVNFVAGFKILMTNMGSSPEQVDMLAKELIVIFSRLMEKTYGNPQ